MLNDMEINTRKQLSNFRPIVTRVYFAPASNETFPVEADIAIQIDNGTAWN